MLYQDPKFQFFFNLLWKSLLSKQAIVIKLLTEHIFPQLLYTHTMLSECVQACKTWNLNLKTLGFKLQKVNNLFWVSRDILIGGDEFALAGR